MATSGAPGDQAPKKMPPVNQAVQAARFAWRQHDWDRADVPNLQDSIDWADAH